jgi:hypothetical protein
MQKKVQQAQRQLERLEKALITERNKQWKLVFRELKQSVRKRNSRMKELGKIRARCG